MADQLPPGVPPSHIPAGNPPPGVTPNFAHPTPTLRPTQIGLSVAFMTVGLIFATTGLIVVACVFTVCYASRAIAYSYVAVHQWDLSLATLSSPHLIKLQYAQDIFTVVSIFVAKAAIIALYLQVFSVNRSVRIACNLAFGINVCAYLPQVIAAYIPCAPHAGQPWDLAVQTRCSQDLDVGIARSTMGTVLDIYLFILPIVPVVQLKIGRKEKIAVLGVFGTALLGVAASACSLAFVTKAYLSTDVLWYAAIIELCNIIEVWIAIIVASMPSFAALFSNWPSSNTIFGHVSTVFSDLLSGPIARRSSPSTNGGGWRHDTEPGDGQQLNNIDAWEANLRNSGVEDTSGSSVKADNVGEGAGGSSV